MSAQTPIKYRSVLIALVIGALPALLTPWIAPDLLRGHDLAIAAAALALLLLAVRLPLRPLPFAERHLILLALTIAAAPTLLGAYRLAAPVSNDEGAYLLQAELFAEARIEEPIPQPAEAFRRRQVHENEERGVRFAKYPPGTALAITPATALGFPAMSTLLAGAASVLLLAAVGRSLGLARPALAALLLALSPFFLLVQTSFQSQVYTLPAALGGYLALLRGARTATPRRAWFWGALLGAGAGWIFLCRPLTGLAFAAACGFGALRSDRRAPLLFGAVLAGLPLAALFLGFNAWWTGDAFQTPYDLYARSIGPFRADGSPLDVYGNGAFLPMLMDQWGRWSVAFAGILGAVALGFWGLFRVRARDGGAGLLFAAAAPLAYSFHWYPGHWAYLGPLYCYESLGLLIVGACLLLQELPPRWSRAFALAALVAGPVAFSARWPLMVKESDLRSLPERLARSETPPGAVVLLPPGLRSVDSAKYWSPSRPPRDAQARVLLRALPQRSLPELLREAGLEDRPVYGFVPDERGGGRLEALKLEL